VAEYANNGISPYNFSTELLEILGNWGNPLTLIERNNQGTAVLERLYHTENYSNIVSYGSGKAARSNKQIGMVSHTNTKYAAVTNMRYWFNDLESVVLHSLETLKEFKHFVRKPNKAWAAERGFHDDRIMALAWALMILHEEIVTKYFEVLDRDDNGRPLKLDPHDYGLHKFTNPLSQYEDAAKNHEQIGMPMIFNDTMEDIDMEDLESLGWTAL